MVVVDPGPNTLSVDATQRVLAGLITLRPGTRKQP
jgi:hypothetical protein